jgi:hypothetical protein
MVFTAEKSDVLSALNDRTIKHSIIITKTKSLIIASLKIDFF